MDQHRSQDVNLSREAGFDLGLGQVSLLWYKIFRSV